MTNITKTLKTTKIAKALKSKIIVALFLAPTLFASSGMAATANGEMELASTTPSTVTYKITDGYGEYTGHGATKIQASAHAREACIMQKITSYENRFGVTPDADTADMFIDACINR